MFDCLVLQWTNPNQVFHIWLRNRLKTSAVLCLGNTVLLRWSHYESSVSVLKCTAHTVYTDVSPRASCLSKLTPCQSSSNGCQTPVCCVWINIRTSSSCRFPTILSDLYYVAGRSLSHSVVSAQVDRFVCQHSLCCLVL